MAGSRPGAQEAAADAAAAADLQSQPWVLTPEPCIEQDPQESHRRRQAMVAAVDSSPARSRHAEEHSLPGSLGPEFCTPDGQSYVSASGRADGRAQDQLACIQGACNAAEVCPCRCPLSNDEQCGLLCPTQPQLPSWTHLPSVGSQHPAQSTPRRQGQVSRPDRTDSGKKRSRDSLLASDLQDICLGMPSPRDTSIQQQQGRSTGIDDAAAGVLSGNGTAAIMSGTERESIPPVTLGMEYPAMTQHGDSRGGGSLQSHAVPSSDFFLQHGMTSKRDSSQQVPCNQHDAGMDLPCSPHPSSPSALTGSNASPLGSMHALGLQPGSQEYWAALGWTLCRNMPRNPAYSVSSKALAVKTSSPKTPPPANSAELDQHGVDFMAEHSGRKGGTAHGQGSDVDARGVVQPVLGDRQQHGHSHVAARQAAGSQGISVAGQQQAQRLLSASDRRQQLHACPAHWPASQTDGSLTENMSQLEGPGRADLMSPCQAVPPAWHQGEEWKLQATQPAEEHVGWYSAGLPASPQQIEHNQMNVDGLLSGNASRSVDARSEVSQRPGDVPQYISHPDMLQDRRTRQSAASPSHEGHDGGNRAAAASGHHVVAPDQEAALARSQAPECDSASQAASIMPYPALDAASSQGFHHLQPFAANGDANFKSALVLQEPSQAVHEPIPALYQQSAPSTSAHSSGAATSQMERESQQIDQSHHGTL